MSALTPKADMCGATRDVCFGPKGDIDLFNHFVCATGQWLQDFEAEGLRRLEVYDQLDLGGLHDRQVYRLVAFKHFARVDAEQTIVLHFIGSVAHQATGRDERTVLV